MRSQFSIFGALEDFNSKFSILLKTRGDRPRIVKPIQMELVDYEPGQYIDPSIQFSHEDAQQIMNEMWRAGLRPESGESTLAHIEAMKSTIKVLEKSHDTFLRIAEAQMVGANNAPNQ